MPQEGKISLLGLANWTNDLFSQMHWPDPFLPTTVDDEEVDPVLSKDAFLDELYAQTAELEVIYPNPEFMKRMIGSWSLTRLPVWNELWATTQYEYNPIENYDRTEDGTDRDTHSGTDSDTHTGTDSDTHSGTDSNAHSGTDSYGNTLSKTGKDTVTDTPDLLTSEGAYNASTADPVNGLAPARHQGGENVSETVYGNTETTNGSTTFGNVETTTHGHVITTTYGDTVTTSHGHVLTTKHDLHVHGNIGTVTSQKMIQEQREVVSFNFYDKMIRDFMERFLVLVY